MKEIITIYKSNAHAVEHYLFTTINQLHFEEWENEHAQKILNNFSCARMVYFVDNDYRLSSPYFLRNNKTDDKRMGASKEYYFSRNDLTDLDQFLSNPYISSNTGKLSVTLVKKIADGYVVIDMDVVSILTHLQLIHSNAMANAINTYVYGFIGFSLLILAVFLAVYAMGTFGLSLFDAQGSLLEHTFKSIIALTLGLAIFDLAKTILENEVFFKSIAVSESADGVFTKFLISIIIALSIESLMVVFKIALNDYTHMINALYLIAGVSLLIVALAAYNVSRRRSEEK